MTMRTSLSVITHLDVADVQGGARTRKAGFMALPVTEFGHFAL